MEKLNQKQKSILVSILNGKNAFVTGFAGSGKSFLVEYICNELRNKKVALTAMTGCAALLINGKTLHSTLGIGLAKGEARDLIKKMRRREGLLQYLLNLEVLIIDEVSMLSDELFDKVAEIFKILHSSTKPFGRLQVILVGDMSQLKPITGEYCFFAKYWDSSLFEVSVLTENMRVNSDISFNNLLQGLRFGKINDLKLIEKMKQNEFTGSLKPTKLFSTNKDVDSINQHELGLLLKNNEPMNYRIHYPDNPVKLLESTKYATDNKISDLLTLCISAQVMVTRNINFDERIVNGTRGVVISLTNTSVTIQLVNGILYNITYFHVKGEDQLTKNLDFKYLPLTLSWAISIHKSQGATIDLLEVDLGQSIFACGQAYVAISRARDSNTVKITNFNKKSIKVDQSVIEFYNKYLI